MAWPLAGLMVAALALRLAVLAAGSYPLESDEAIVGLMARHILEGERPVFYYGQPYMGAAEAYLVAALFWAAGASTFVLRLGPLAVSLAFVCLVWKLGSDVFGEKVGLASAAYVALSPPFLTMWSLKARGGYIETLALGSAILLLVVGIAYREHDSWPWWAGLGLLGGLALWINELILPYLVAALVTLFLWRRTFLWSWRFLAAVAGAGLGGLPLWAYNWQHPMATFQHLVEANAAGSISATFLRNLLDVGRYASPVLLGALQATSCLECFHQQRAAAGALYFLGLAAVAGLAVLVLYRFGQSLRQLGKLSFDPGRRETPLLALLLASPLLFSASQVGFLHYSEPRYLLPLYSAVPLFLAAVFRLLGDRTRWLVALLALVLAFNLQANWRVDPALAMPVIEDGKRPSHSNVELASFLRARGIGHVYTDYWIAYTLGFESEERVIPSVVLPDLDIGYNRYLPYAHQVSVAENPAYVFLRGTKAEAGFVGRTRAEGVSYRREEVGPYAVYYDLDPPRHVR